MYMNYKMGAVNVNIKMIKKWNPNCNNKLNTRRTFMQ